MHKTRIIKKPKLNWKQKSFEKNNIGRFGKFKNPYRLNQKNNQTIFEGINSNANSEQISKENTLKNQTNSFTKK